MYFNLRIVTKDGDEIPARDAVRNFIKSPAFREFWKNLGALWQHAREFGFMSTFQQLIESLDPLGEKNALKVNGVFNNIMCRYIAWQSEISVCPFIGPWPFERRQPGRD